MLAEKKLRDKAAILVVILVVFVLLYHGYQKIYPRSTTPSNGTTSLTVPTATIQRFPVRRLPPTKSVIIVSTWRSGSSTFASIISAHPDIFLHYEPLDFHQGPISDLDDDRAPQYVEDITNIYLKCSYDDISPSNLTQMYNSRPYLEKNNKLPKKCKVPRPVKEDNPCLNRDFMKNICANHPIQVVKYVRISLHQIEGMLDKYPDLKVIWLVRDPRAVWNSRVNNKSVKSWCGYETCGNITRLCQSYDINIKVSKRLNKYHSQQFLVQKFEVLQNDPFGAGDIIVDFLGLENGDAILNKISDLSKNTNFTTKRDWHDYLTEEQREIVQDNCMSSMIELEYDLF